MPALKMPAFSSAILGQRVAQAGPCGPLLMLVMAVTSGVITLVLSSRPPKPRFHDRDVDVLFGESI